MAGISLVLPSAVVSAESRGDPVEAELLPAEARLVARAVARAVEKRRREVTTGRHCARTALGRLGAPQVAIMAGAAGEPLWPDGVVGSITHCNGYRAAAVAWASHLRSLGIDAEPHSPLPDGVLDVVARPEERPQLHHAAEAGVHGDRLLFCAKEAVYKAWYPLGRQVLDFVDLAVALSGDGTFAARLKVRGPVASLEGRWVVDGDLLLAAVVVRPRGARGPAGRGPPG